MKTMRMDLENLSSERFGAMLERLEMGYPLKFKNERPRDPEKSKALVEFYVRITPSAKEILSGRAFRKLLK